MSGRVATATSLGFREQVRRPLLLVLLTVLPFFFITRAIAVTQPTPRRIGLPGGGQVLTTMRGVHGALMAAITVAFLAGLCGAFIMYSARQGDRRLIVAGYRPRQAIIPRLIVLVAATTLVLTVSLSVTALSFAPRSWALFALGTLMIGLIYACIGAIAGALLNQIAATYLILFLALLGIGILQNPMFGDGTPGGVAMLFPDYGAARVVISSGFADHFHAWPQLAASAIWLAALVSLVTLVLQRGLRPS